jgi:hypothetical protein
MILTGRLRRGRTGRRRDAAPLEPLEQLCQFALLLRIQVWFHRFHASIEHRFDLRLVFPPQFPHFVHGAVHYPSNVRLLLFGQVQFMGEFLHDQLFYSGRAMASKALHGVLDVQVRAYRADKDAGEEYSRQPQPDFP